MNRQEAQKIIKDKNLKHFLWYKDSNYEPNNLVITRRNNKFVVYMTSERGAPGGDEEFDNEGIALDRFISRLESLNRLMNKNSEYYL